jgi:hypothetical protein
MASFFLTFPVLFQNTQQGPGVEEREAFNLWHVCARVHLPAPEDPA